MGNNSKNKQILLFLLGSYGSDFFVGVHALITYCPSNLFSWMCVLTLAIYLIYQNDG